MTEYLYILPEGVLGILNPKTPRYSCKYRRDTLPLGTAIFMTRCSRVVDTLVAVVSISLLHNQVIK